MEFSYPSRSRSILTAEEFADFLASFARDRPLFSTDGVHVSCEQRQASSPHVDAREQHPDRTASQERRDNHRCVV